jgi:hypothetical protein
MEMKKRIKKIGVLAVLLANVAIFAPKEAEGQRTIVIDNMDGPTDREYKRYDITVLGTHYIICQGQGWGCIPSITVKP